MCDTHTHSHSEGHSHDHSNEGHCHCHEGNAAHSAEENVALLNYMLDHNRHHGEDLHEIFHALQHAGKTEAAEAVHEALHLFDAGNEKLAEALKIVGGK